MTLPDTLALREFAGHIGSRPSYVTELKKAGRLVLTEDGRRVKVAESLARIQATRDPARAGVAARHAEARGTALAATAPAAEEGDDDEDDDPEPPPELANNPDFQKARAKREHYKAEREQAAYYADVGQLLNRDAVRGAVAEILAQLRQRLETLPDTLAPELAAMADEQDIRARLAEEVEVLLAAASSGFSAMAKEGM